MSFSLRILCVVGAAITVAIVGRGIKSKKIQMEDSIFWVLLSVMLLVVAAIPRLATRLSELLGFQAPSNFVFVTVIAILLVKLFSLSAEVSSLKHGLHELAQEEALLARHAPSAQAKDVHG